MKILWKIKKIRENKNWIIILMLLFLAFPIEELISNRFFSIFMAFSINIILIFITLYYITKFISDFLIYAENYKFEISRKNLLKMNALSNNYRFFITMTFTLVFFGLAILLTMQSFARTTNVTVDINWWNNYEVYKYLNMDNINKFMMLFILTVNVFLIYASAYILICVFIYFVLDIVSKINKDFLEKIYKSSSKLKSIMTNIFEDIQSIDFNAINIEKSWNSTVILIFSYESDQLKISKKGKTPPDFLIF